jgi:drug/metabolite transporter (DMT)-like permease
MIQRKQTLWLLMSIICTALTVLFSTYVGADANNVMQIIKGSSSPILSIITAAIIVINAIAIFLFKKRNNQIKLIGLGIVVWLILMFTYYTAIQKLPTKGSYSITAILHVVSLFFKVLAIKFIYDDEKLLKESNRLR